jgi:hypothetical protein
MCPVYASSPAAPGAMAMVGTITIGIIILLLFVN